MICIVELLYLISCLVNTKILLRNVNTFGTKDKYSSIYHNVFGMLCRVR
jgi:hypothetical protein